MPFFLSTLKASLQSGKQSTYDLQARVEGAAAPPGELDAEPAGVGQAGGEQTVQGISIAAHQQYSYVPNMDTTKSLATDIIQLTRFKNRRPTIPEDRPQRKPSFRNIFLGVPEPNARRFSQDIGGAALVAKFKALESKETTRVLFLQVFIPFLLSGFGNVGAGLFLNYAQTWQVFRDNTIFYMLLATVMAFKTNLEATLAARLSTCSNMGSIKTLAKKFEAFLGNLALAQTQSIIFGLMSSGLVVLISSVEQGHFQPSLALRTMATGVAAICINEVISSVLILLVVVASERAGVNPDNVSTLIAAMFGDFTSVFFISVTAAVFHTIQSQGQWLFVGILCGALCLLPLTLLLASRNEFTRGMFLGTHLPLALAVTVATISGLVFDHAVQSFARIAIYQAVVNGVSVNLMAVQTSRIATYLAKLNAVAPDRAKEYSNKCSPVEALFAQDMNASVARWLIAMCVPAMSVYLCFIMLVAPAYVDVTLILIACCLVSILAQVTFIQCLTYMVTPISWRLDWDPDNVVIPVLMSISDCSGNAILLTAFMFLQYMEDPNSAAPEAIGSSYNFSNSSSNFDSNHNRRAQRRTSKWTAHERAQNAHAADHQPQTPGHKWQSIGALGAQEPAARKNFARLRKGYASMRKSFRTQVLGGGGDSTSGYLQAPAASNSKPLITQIGSKLMGRAGNLQKRLNKSPLYEATSLANDALQATSGSFKFISSAAQEFEIYAGCGPTMAVSGSEQQRPPPPPPKSEAEREVEARLRRSKRRVLPSAQYRAPDSERACEGLDLNQLEAIKRDNLRLTLRSGQKGASAAAARRRHETGDCASSSSHESISHRQAEPMALEAIVCSCKHIEGRSLRRAHQELEKSYEEIKQQQQYYCSCASMSSFSYESDHGDDRDESPCRPETPEEARERMNLEAKFCDQSHQEFVNLLTEGRKALSQPNLSSYFHLAATAERDGDDASELAADEEEEQKEQPVGLETIHKTNELRNEIIPTFETAKTIEITIAGKKEPEQEEEQQQVAEQGPAAEELRTAGDTHAASGGGGGGFVTLNVRELERLCGDLVSSCRASQAVAGETERQSGDALAGRDEHFHLDDYRRRAQEKCPAPDDVAPGDGQQQKQQQQQQQQQRAAWLEREGEEFELTKSGDSNERQCGSPLAQRVEQCEQRADNNVAAVVVAGRAGALLAEGGVSPRAQRTAAAAAGGSERRATRERRCRTTATSTHTAAPASDREVRCAPNNAAGSSSSSHLSLVETADFRDHCRPHEWQSAEQQDQAQANDSPAQLTANPADQVDSSSSTTTGTTTTTTSVANHSKLISPPPGQDYERGQTSVEIERRRRQQRRRDEIMLSLTGRLTQPPGDLWPELARGTNERAVDTKPPPAAENIYSDLYEPAPAASAQEQWGHYCVIMGDHHEELREKERRLFEEQLNHLRMLQEAEGAHLQQYEITTPGIPSYTTNNKPKRFINGGQQLQQKKSLFGKIKSLLAPGAASVRGESDTFAAPSGLAAARWLTLASGKVPPPPSLERRRCWDDEFRSTSHLDSYGRSGGGGGASNKWHDNERASPHVEPQQRRRGLSSVSTQNLFNSSMRLLSSSRKSINRLKATRREEGATQHEDATGFFSSKSFISGFLTLGRRSGAAAAAASSAAGKSDSKKVPRGGKKHPGQDYGESLGQLFKEPNGQLRRGYGSFDSLPSADSGLSCGHLQNSSSCDETNNCTAAAASRGSTAVENIYSCGAPAHAANEQKFIYDDEDDEEEECEGDCDGRVNYGANHDSQSPCTVADTRALPVVGRARAKVDCNPCAYDKEALVFKRGDLIDILERHQSGTWIGRCGAQVGHFKFINVVEMCAGAADGRAEPAPDAYVTKLEIRNRSLSTASRAELELTKKENQKTEETTPSQLANSRSSEPLMGSLEQLLASIGLNNCRPDQMVAATARGDRSSSCANLTTTSREVEGGRCRAAREIAKSADEERNSLSYLDMLRRGGINSLDSFSALERTGELEQIGILDEEHKRRLLMAAKIIRQALRAAKLDMAAAATHDHNQAKSRESEGESVAIEVEGADDDDRAPPRPPQPPPAAARPTDMNDDGDQSDKGVKSRREHTHQAAAAAAGQWQSAVALGTMPTTRVAGGNQREPVYVNLVSRRTTITTNGEPHAGRQQSAAARSESGAARAAARGAASSASSSSGKSIPAKQQQQLSRETVTATDRRHLTTFGTRFLFNDLAQDENENESELEQEHGKGAQLSALDYRYRARDLGNECTAETASDQMGYPSRASGARRQPHLRARVNNQSANSISHPSDCGYRQAQEQDHEPTGEPCERDFYATADANNNQHQLGCQESMISGRPVAPFTRGCSVRVSSRKPKVAQGAGRTRINSRLVPRRGSQDLSARAVEPASGCHYVQHLYTPSRARAKCPAPPPEVPARANHQQHHQHHHHQERHLVAATSTTSTGSHALAQQLLNSRSAYDLRVNFSKFLE